MNINLADLLKLPVKIFAAIALGTGLVLFLPDAFINQIYLSSFRESFGFVLGLIFVISISIVGVTGVITIYKALSINILYLKTKKARIECINNLDDYQYSLVYLLYNEINHTLELPIHDGSVHWLEQNWIIGKAGNQHFISNIDSPEFPYMLQPWAIEYINSHNDLRERMNKATESLKDRLEKRKFHSW